MGEQKKRRKENSKENMKKSRAWEGLALSLPALCFFTCLPPGGGMALRSGDIPKTCIPWHCISMEWEVGRGTRQASFPVWEDCPACACLPHLPPPPMGWGQACCFGCLAWRQAGGRNPCRHLPACTVIVSLLYELYLPHYLHTHTLPCLPSFPF